MVPMFNCGDDFVGVCGPSGWFGFLVVLGKEAVDCRLEVDVGVEDASLETTLRQFGEEAFDRIEPGARGRREVEGEARMAIELRIPPTQDSDSAKYGTGVPVMSGQPGVAGSR
ncbi:hypothetical protein MesoLj131a_61840 [Mesorhizobium sp. 131-2-1]|nr:hypothetical protein MesoLj131a_61840 [Mesorhizobium sp. 131-2-1]BCH04391.1 hypothetical protein MesoLj131b_63900 [Mesorhizobium sp. 131-2-5]